MIRNEFYTTREDGVKLYRTFSDFGMMLRKNDSDELYAEAIDVEGCDFSYSETDIPITEDRELTVEDTIGMLNELGVDTDDKAQ